MKGFGSKATHCGLLAWLLLTTAPAAQAASEHGIGGSAPSDRSSSTVVEVPSAVRRQRFTETALTIAIIAAVAATLGGHGDVVRRDRPTRARR